MDRPVIACATDDAYVPHCAAMLHSLLSHPEHAGAEVHLLHGEGRLTDGLAAQLKRFVDTCGGAELQCHAVSDLQIARFPTRQFHESCWYRILLPELLPHADRILYLDSDLIVADSLRPLWNSNLDDCSLAAVMNPLYPFMSNRAVVKLGLDCAQDYLNSGVLLMNLERMRNEGLTEQIQSYAAAHPDNCWPEQDALSVVLHGKWHRLHQRWNLQTTVFDVKPEALSVDAAEIQEALASPAVVHYIGPQKPWTYLCTHPMKDLYTAHRRQTPWSEWQLQGRSLLNMLIKPLSYHWQLRIQRLPEKLGFRS